MRSKSEEYAPLHRDSSDRWSDESKETLSPAKQHKASQNPLYICSLIVSIILLAMSLFVNMIFILRIQPNQQIAKSSLAEGDCPSTHAGLRRDVPVAIQHGSEYTGDNLTEVRALWEELSGDPGVVALPEAYVQQTKLPHALRFPWDEDKGVYLVQGFHDLHCLVCYGLSLNYTSNNTKLTLSPSPAPHQRTLFRYVMYTELKQPQHIALSHALHCLDQLRQGVICNADDTPRYAGFQDPPGTGSGQVRMCRDWRRLERWAEERTACFRHEDEVPGPMIERFKSCPDGRVLWPTTTAAAAAAGKSKEATGET
ncbi:hypothetical protein MY5147_008724 [Beauveria neobassiana]